MSPAKTKRPARSGRIAIIDAVRTPLNFFVLVVLVVEGGLGGLAVKSTTNIMTIVYLMVAVLLALVIAVVAMAFAKPELVLPGNAREGSSHMKRFSEGIAGHWWEEMEPREPTAVSFVEISPDLATGSVRMTGRAYSQAGELAATWESVAACVNANERKVFYSWKGQHPSRAKEPYEGFGEISFHDSLHSGDGLFLDINISNWGITRKTTTLGRASKEDLQVMRNSDHRGIKDLVQKHATA